MAIPRYFTAVSSLVALALLSVVLQRPPSLGNGEIAPEGPGSVLRSNLGREARTGCEGTAAKCPRNLQGLSERRTCMFLRRPNYCLRTTKKANNSKPLDALTPKPQRMSSL